MLAVVVLVKKKKACILSNYWPSIVCVNIFFQLEGGIRDDLVTGVQTYALPICWRWRQRPRQARGSLARAPADGRAPRPRSGPATRRTRRSRAHTTTSAFAA